MMRILLAAGLAWLGIGLAGPGAACDSEPRQSAEADVRAARPHDRADDHGRLPRARASATPASLPCTTSSPRARSAALCSFPDNIRSPGNSARSPPILRNANSSPSRSSPSIRKAAWCSGSTRRNGHGYFPSARKMGARSEIRSRRRPPRASTSAWPTNSPRPASISISVPWSISPQSRELCHRSAEAELRADPKTVPRLPAPSSPPIARPISSTVAKHFPGPRLELERQPQIAPRHFREPGRRSSLSPIGARQDGLLDMVMVGHLYHPRFSDGEKLPASLSERAVRALGPRAISAFRAWWSATTWRWARCARLFARGARGQGRQCRRRPARVFQREVARPRARRQVHAIIADAVRDGRISRSRIEKAYGRSCC